MKYLEYTVIIEKSETGYSAYVPDLPGCIALGKTKSEVRKLIRKGIKYHIEELIKDGDIIPKPESDSFKIKLVIT